MWCGKTKKHDIEQQPLANLYRTNPSSPSSSHDSTSASPPSVLPVPTCRICHEGAAEGVLISPCVCRGSMKYVHRECLDRWRRSSANPRSVWVFSLPPLCHAIYDIWPVTMMITPKECDQCHYRYHFRRSHAARCLQSTIVLHGVTILVMIVLIFITGIGCQSMIMRANPKNKDVSFELLEIMKHGSIFVGVCGLIDGLIRLACGTGHTSMFDNVSSGSSGSTNTPVEGLFAIIVMVGLIWVCLGVYDQVKTMSSSTLCQAAATIENIQLTNRLPANNRRPGLKQRQRLQRQRVHHPYADVVELFDNE